jgi:hypothetical protein
MVQMSNKWFIAIVAIAILIAVLLVLVAMDFMGWGTAVAGFGGPVAAGLYDLFNTVPLWISSGGWPTLAVGMIVFLVVIPVIAGYVFEQKQVIATIKGTNTSTSGTYQSQPDQNIIPLSNQQSTPTQNNKE